MNAGELPDRIALRRFVDNHDKGQWVDFIPPETWAAVQPQGDDTYRVRTRYRADLRRKADLEPAVRMWFEGEEYDVTDVVEIVRRHEIQLTASRRIITDILHLASGARRLKAWP